YDENTAGVMLSQDQLPTLPAEITTLFLGGISLVNDPAASTYAAFQAREAATRVTMIDPNIRLGFIAGKAAQYRTRIEAMIAMADIVKLSDEDLVWVMGEGDVETLARQIIAQGPKVVFITEGAAGARAITATQNRFVAAQKIVVADTVGAGDTFNAGALSALDSAGALTKARLAAITDAELDAALSLGTRAAAITCSRPGANPPWANEL
ncbi:MAG: PfkB family carbohydrate kinase, partial [bacterium]